MNNLRSYVFVHLVVVSVLKECMTLGPKDSIDLSFDMQQNDEDLVSINFYTLLFICLNCEGTPLDIY